MNKFCFTQSESNKSYCKTQSSIIYIPLLIFFNFILFVSISSVNSYSLGTVFSNCNLYIVLMKKKNIDVCLHVNVRINF